MRTAIEVILMVIATMQNSEGTWNALGGGVNGLVSAIAVSGSDVYVGGVFREVDGSPVSRIARWDGTSWSVLGSGVNNSVTAIAVSGSDVYVGGTFTEAGGRSAIGIARWDGSSWHSVGTGVGGDSPFVLAIAVSGSDVYVGGSFTQAGGSPANRIARWDGSSWHPVGTGVGGSGGVGGDRPIVKAIAVSGSDVYVGGSFTQAGGSPANRIARWDGSSWHALGSGVSCDEQTLISVDAIAVSGSDVYVGGNFTQAGRSPASRIARWDGSSWYALGSGVSGGGTEELYYGSYLTSVMDIAVSGSNLYVGGIFTRAGANQANYTAFWDGNSWHALGGGLSKENSDPWVEAIAVSGSDVYVGGWFTQAGSNPAQFIARWSGN